MVTRSFVLSKLPIGLVGIGGDYRINAYNVINWALLGYKVYSQIEGVF